MYPTQGGYDSYVPGKYSGSNNLYYKQGCPALMSDARFLTNYNSSSEVTDSMRRMNGFESSNKFRTFMQANGQMFMEAETKYLVSHNTCTPKTACSEGWYDLWTKDKGSWATLSNSSIQKN